MPRMTAVHLMFIALDIANNQVVRYSEKDGKTLFGAQDDWVPSVLGLKMTVISLCGQCSFRLRKGVVRN